MKLNYYLVKLSPLGLVSTINAKTQERVEDK